MGVKRILHIVGNMAPDGMSNFLMNIYRRLDRERLQFDFIVMGEKHPNYHEEIKELGGRLFRIPRMAAHPLAHYREIRRIVREGGYSMVFRHTDTCTIAPELLAAKRGGALEVIPHAHSTKALHPFFNHLFRPMVNQLATNRFACGRAAGDWMFGGAPYRIVYNGIELEQFCFSAEERRRIRKELNIADGVSAIGHVGNFFSAKNHLFLLEVFAEIKKLHEKSILLLIGDGELRPQIEEKIGALGLKDDVRLLGERHDVDKLLQALDLMLFPSLYEGLPIALVEAQACALPVLYSDSISDEVRLTEKVRPFSLKAPAGRWAEEALTLLDKEGRGRENADPIPVLRAAGYDLKDLVGFYQRLGKYDH